MRTRVRYSEGEIGRLRAIRDFLPAPEALVPCEEKNFPSSRAQCSTTEAPSRVVRDASK